MSVGHVARTFEEAKISTVVIAVKSFETRIRMMSLPRTLLTPNLLGRPMGIPQDDEEQTNILKAAFKLLESATKNGTVVDYY